MLRPGASSAVMTSYTYSKLELMQYPTFIAQAETGYNQASSSHSSGRDEQKQNYTTSLFLRESALTKSTMMEGNICLIQIALCYIAVKSLGNTHLSLLRQIYVQQLFSADFEVECFIETHYHNDGM